MLETRSFHVLSYAVLLVLAASASLTLDQILIDLFYTWRPYKVLLQILKHDYHIRKSLRWLKAQFRRLGLSRRSRDPPQRTIRTIIRAELVTSNRLLGYRSMWQLLRNKYHLVVRRDTIMKILRDEDPEGCEQRKKKRLKRRIYRSKGPNYIWHVDGYDKLTPFGITIHGCIDGYSRKMLWLKTAPSNSNPRVIARYYLETVEDLAVCPRVLRSDYGTENVRLGAIQIALRFHHTDSMAREKSFLYGPSKSNVRIEGWWSQLRRRKTHWWIELLKNLVHEGYLNCKNVFHRSCLAYAMIKPLQSDLEEFVENWNSHLIRRNRLSMSPGGVPNELYKYPFLNATQDYGKSVDVNVWLNAMVRESETPPPFYSQEFEEWANFVLLRDFHMEQKDITQSDCCDIFRHLIRESETSDEE